MKNTLFNYGFRVLIEISAPLKIEILKENRCKLDSKKTSFKIINSQKNQSLSAWKHR